jgi:hypothetical protein
MRDPEDDLLVGAALRLTLGLLALAVGLFLWGLFLEWNAPR